MASHNRCLASFARGVERHFSTVMAGKFVGWEHRLRCKGTIARDIELLKAAVQFCAQHNTPWSHIIRRPDDSEFSVYTDAAGKHGGIGGYIHLPEAPHFQIHWNEVETLAHCDIVWKEMVAIFCMIRAQLQDLSGHHITFWCDNKPAVWMLIKGRAAFHRPDLQHLVREIHRLCIFGRITPWWDHIPGDDNKTADRLSRFLSAPFGPKGSAGGCRPGPNINEAARVALRRALIDTKEFVIDAAHLYTGDSAMRSDFRDIGGQSGDP